MKINLTNRQFLSATVIIFYLLPWLFFSSYSIGLMSHHKSWNLLSIGLLLVAFGTLILILMLYYWEESVITQSKQDASPLELSQSSALNKEAKVTSLDPALFFNQSTHYAPLHEDATENVKELNLLQTALKESQELQEQLSRDLELKTQELQEREEETQQLRLKAEQAAQDFADYKLFSEEQLKQKQLQFNALQQMIEDQRSEMEKRQEQIHQLDTKVHDLSYEIKTLLYLHEEETAPLKVNVKKEELTPFFKPTPIETYPSISVQLEESIPLESETNESPIQSSLDALKLLRKCIQTAEKLTGANYHNTESSRYRELSPSYYALDQRRLFDCIRHDPSALMMVYSQKEQKVLFVNTKVRTLLGWTQEKFIADFSVILQEGLLEWKKAISLLSTLPEAQARLIAKTKNGQEIFLDGYVGVIPSGLFRQYVMAVFYPV